MINLKSLKYTKLILFFLFAIFVLLIIGSFRPKPSISPPASSSPSPTPISKLDVPEDKNSPNRLTSPQQATETEFVFYDKELEEIILVSGNESKTLYQGKADSYAYISPFLYILNKDFPNRLAVINTQTNQVETFSPPHTSPILFISSCSGSNKLLLIGNYSATKRDSSVYLYLPQTKSFSPLATNIGATSIQCQNNTAAIFSYADFAGASTVRIIDLETRNNLLEVNGNDFSISPDGKHVAVENGNIIIYSLGSSETIELPDSNKYHFSWFKQSLFLLQNNHPGISIKLFNMMDSTFTPLAAPNQDQIIVRKLIKVMDHIFLYQSDTGAIAQEVFSQAEQP